MDFFNEISPLYFDKNLQVVPLKGKNPSIGGGDWNLKNFEGKSFPGCNLGLKTGQVNGVICLDIDVTDEKLKEKLVAVIDEEAYSPVQRRGNKSKPPARFYSYTNEERKLTISKPGVDDRIELLTNGQQVTLPPSIHPDFKYPFEWIGQSLLDFDLEYLPPLPADLWAKLEKIFHDHYRGHTKENSPTHAVTPSDGSRCNHGSHNKLSEMLVAKVLESTPLDQTVQELLEYDEQINPVISYFVCPSRSEWKTKDKRYNCLQFAMEGYQRRLKSGDIPEMPGSHIPTIEIVEQREPTPMERSSWKTKFRGINEIMFNYVYETSIVPRTRLAIPSVLSLMSVTLGNRIRLDKIFPNLFSVMICPSGGGKDNPLNFPRNALYAAGCEHLVGQENAVSDASVIKMLEKRPVRIDTIDEMEILFKAVGSKDNVFQSNLGAAYSTLFSKTGEYFNGRYLATQARKKDEEEGKCFGPYVVLLGAITPARFSDTFMASMVEQGLGARFLYFPDTEIKRPNFGTRVSKPFPEEITSFIKQWRDITDAENVCLTETLPPEIGHDRSIYGVIEEYGNRWFDLGMKHDYDTPISAKLRRMAATHTKLAIIDACSVSWGVSEWPRLTKKNYDWAWEFLQEYLDNALPFFEEYVGRSRYDKDLKRVEAYIRKHGTISDKQLKQAYKGRLRVKELSDIMAALVQSGSVIEGVSKDSVQKEKMYRTI